MREPWSLFVVVVGLIHSLVAVAVLDAQGLNPCGDSFTIATVAIPLSCDVCGVNLTGDSPDNVQCGKGTYGVGVPLKSGEPNCLSQGGGCLYSGDCYTSEFDMTMCDSCILTNASGSLICFNPTVTVSGVSDAFSNSSNYNTSTESFGSTTITVEQLKTEMLSYSYTDWNGTSQTANPFRNPLTDGQQIAVVYELDGKDFAAGYSFLEVDWVSLPSENEPLNYEIQSYGQQLLLIDPGYSRAGDYSFFLVFGNANSPTSHYKSSDPTIYNPGESDPPDPPKK